MIEKNAFAVQMVDPEDDSTLNNMIRSSGKICAAELLVTSIEDVRMKKETMASMIDSITSLMEEVEYEEKAAKQTKKEAVWIRSDTKLKVSELMYAQQLVKGENERLAREAYEQKKLLSTTMEALQLHVTSLLDRGDIELLDEMSRSLKMRLSSARSEKELAIKKKNETEVFAQAALACEKFRLKEMEEELKRLKQEAADNSKLQGFLIDRGHLVSVLHGEISDKCHDVKLLKEELNHVQKTTDYKQIKIVIGFSEADTKSPHGAADSGRSIKKVKSKGKQHGYQTKIKRKLYAIQLFAKYVKKSKTKGKLNAKQIFDISIRKVNLKGKLHGNEMFTKSIKKLKIKDMRHHSQSRAKSIKKLKINVKRHVSQTREKSTKEVKVKGKLHRNQLCAKSIKKVKIKDKRHCSQPRAKSLKKLKMKVKRHGSQTCSKSIKEVKVKSKLHRNQPCVKSIKKVKIKGLSESLRGQVW